MVTTHDDEAFQGPTDAELLELVAEEAGEEELQAQEPEATPDPLCAICGRPLEAERLRMAAKTCVSPDCQREWRSQRDKARKALRA